MRTVTLPAGKKTGVRNARPMLHPKNADGLIKLAMTVHTNADVEIQKAARYVYELGMYLSSPQYMKAKEYRLAAKARHMKTKEK